MSEQAQTQTTPEQRAELLLLAEAADKQEPGPWSVGCLSDEDDPEVNPDDICDYEVLSEYTPQDGRIGVSTVAQGMHKPAAEFIAAANPVAVKVLLADLTAAEQRAAEWQHLSDQTAKALEEALAERELLKVRAAVAEKAVELLASWLSRYIWAGAGADTIIASAEEKRDRAYREARAVLGLAAPAEQ